MTSSQGATATPSYLEPGAILKGRYEVLHEIGRGGHSAVYAARDRELRMEVAIKLLVPPPAVAHIARERMRREVLAVRGLSHSNIVAVYDYVDGGPWSFIVMELVAGPDLGGRVRDHGSLDVDEVVRVGSGIADALSLAHRRGILHRDVKPQNILLDGDGRPRLTDFGSARLDGQVTLTATDALIGTPSYLAPEILAGRRADARSDLYSLGLTLYYALVSELPRRASPHVAPPPAADGYHPCAVRREIPEWLDNIIARATAADPDDRFPTAASLVDAFAHGNAGTALIGRSLRERVDVCVLCDAPEPLGLNVCPRCGGTSPDVADTLIFVRRGVPIPDLVGLLGPRASSDASAAAARGNRALLQVPAVVAPRVIQQLDSRGIPARSVAVDRAWTTLPFSFFAMIAAVVAMGGVAAAAQQTLLWTTPSIAVLLLVAAERRVRSPLLAAPKAARRLPSELEAKVLEAFAALPAGTARSLLADIVRLAQVLFARLSQRGHEQAADPGVRELVVAACDAARELANLDETLSHLEAQRERLPALSASWLDELARCERTRDAMVQQLLEAVTVLGRLCSRSSDAAELAEDKVREMTRTLAREVEIRAAAREEVEELLRPPVQAKT